MSDRTTPRSSRRCIASGEILPKAALLRFVVSAEGRLVFDADGRLPGTGLWLQADRSHVERACSRRLFAKAARCSVEVPPDFVGHVTRRLRQRCLNTLGLARRAGQCVMGYEKTCQALRGTGVAALLVAADGSQAEVAKVRAKAHGLPVIDVFSAAELGGAAGRPRTVHAAILKGRLATTLSGDVFRLRGIQDGAENMAPHDSSVSTNTHTGLR